MTDIACPHIKQHFLTCRQTVFLLFLLVQGVPKKTWINVFNLLSIPSITSRLSCFTDIWTETTKLNWTTSLWLFAVHLKYKIMTFNPMTPRGGGLMQPPPLAFFPCNFFYDSNRKNRLSVSVTRDGRHILTYVTSSWRYHVTYVMTSYVHDGGQNTLFLP